MNQPALFKHCQVVYDAMLETAVENVWKGHTTALVDSLPIPKGYYGKIYDCLKQMGSVQQLRRGGGKPPSDSEWLLVKPPDPNVFYDARKPKTQESTIVLTQRYKDLNDRVLLLEGQVARALRILEEVVEKLETKE